MDKLGKEGKVTEAVKETIGTVKIADDVVAMIAGMAAAEVEGVSAMTSAIASPKAVAKGTAVSGHFAADLMSKSGMKNIAKSVKVEIIGKRVHVEMALNVDYGYNIPAISQKVQAKVKAAIENMTGLLVTDVNLRIAGVNNVV
ncbi:MAG: Asp23/Gls24 family envelope stress response protein [Lachnospiraceae bacterium]|jgi:uncharacterized alkaline shock family protein YloU|nr:Asp23/Gls24 family envelope stress response protein [Lachnospiraceae bacterium]